MGMYIYIHIYVNTYICIYTYMYIYIYVCKYVCTHIQAVDNACIDLVVLVDERHWYVYKHKHLNVCDHRSIYI